MPLSLTLFSLFASFYCYLTIVIYKTCRLSAASDKISAKALAKAVKTNEVCAAIAGIIRI
jgi:hypothetical protein